MSEIRLNRYLSICGVTSRRKADELISAGRVSVNGNPVRELGSKIDPEKDNVFVDDMEVKKETKRYIKFNKPRFTVTTLADREGDKKTIKNLLSGIRQRVYPVGRLDFDAEGLLLLTNDGELAQKIHHPANLVTKVYIARVRGKLSEREIRDIRKGATLEEGFVTPDNAELLDGNTIKISFHEGKKHLVKRYLGSFGFPVEYLKRTGIDGINLGKLPVGKWKDLTREELRTIKISAGLE